MYRSNIYPKMILLVSFFVLAFNSVFAQTPSMQLKLQLLAPNKWGVYVRPIGVTPSTSQTITIGGDQVTIVAPLNYPISNLTSINGNWQNNAPVHGPIENPGASYYSFGFVSETVPIPYQAGTETLLFTFEGNLCPDSLHIIDNNTDPFNLPVINGGANSVGNNPGNEFAVFDMITAETYSYLGIYSPFAWDCHDCDGDGILNAFEDSDGDGVYVANDEDDDNDGILDPGEDDDNDGYLDPDASQICNPCDPFHPESAALELIGGADVICAGDVGDTAWFKVTIEGGWPPYTLNYTDGTTNYQELLYYSGDSIWFIPTASTTLSISTVVDSFNCLLNTNLGAPINFSVHGPISITDEPDPVTECFGNGTQFCIDFDNDGDGYTYKKWQVNTGSGWVDIQDGGVYDNTDSVCVAIANVANKHNYQYRCKIFTDVCDTVYSAAALLQVEGPISVTTNPVDFTNCDSENASFSAVTANAGAVGTRSYQWQYSITGTSNTFYDLPSGAGPGGSIYGGVTTQNLSLTTIDTIQDGWYFRMKVSTGQCDTVFTTAARLNVEGAVTVVDQPDNISNCAGSEVYFVTCFENAGYQYPSDPNQTVTNYIWQVSTNGGGSWANLTNVSGVYSGISGSSVGGTGCDSLTISNVVGLDGNMYRICYTTPTCSVPVYSNPATLDVSGNVTFSVDPKDATVCSGNDTTFFATASIPQGSFTMSWQYSDDNGATWIDIDFVVDAALFQHTQTGLLPSPAPATDVLTVSNVASMYGRRFRAVADATDCNAVYSNYAILSVEGPLAESVVPASVTECSGNPTTFTGGFTNPGVAGSTIYRWQVSSTGSGGPWTDLTNGIPYNGTGTTQLSITNVEGLHGYCFRLSARTSTCNKIFGTVACLTVEGPITVTAQPVTVDLCSGDGTSFTSTANVGTAGTLVYQWQLLNNASAWEDITVGSDGGVYSGINSTTLNVSNVAGLYNRCYRLAFSTGECLRVFSDPACMNIDGPLSITNHPDDIIQCSGEGVLFGAKAATASTETNGTGLIQYQWEESTDDTLTWHEVTNDTLYNGTNSDTLSITYTTNLDGNYYRMKIWTDNCDTVYTYAALLDVEGPMAVTQEPSSITECAGSGVTFQSTVSLQNGDPGTLIYQWEVAQYNQGTGTYGAYTNVVDGGVYSGATTTTLNISDVAGMYFWRFRMRYRTPNCDAQWSNYATLTVEGPIDFAVGGHPDDVVECSGNPAVFNVTTTNNSVAAIQYQWEILVDPLADTTDANNWIPLVNNSIYNGTKTASLSISNVADLNGFRYRVRIQTSTCSSSESYSALLTVEGPLLFTAHPEDITQCSGESVTFTGAAEIAVGNAGTITYQWQWSDNAQCVNYTNISAAGVNAFSGWNTPTLTVGNVAGITGRCFRLAVKTGECNNSYSFPAKLTVEGPLTIPPTGHPQDFVNCSDKEAFFFTQVNNPAAGGPDAVLNQWQWSADGGTTWTNIVQIVNAIGSDTVNVSGYDNDSLFISPIKGLNGYLFRNIFWTETCNRDTTDAAELTVEGPVTFTLQPEDVQTCFGDTVRYNIQIANSTGEGTVQYQWEKWSAGGWSNLSNSAPYSGTTTQQLTIAPPYTNLYNAKFRCKVKTGNCEWEFSDLANLFLEGPVTWNLQPMDASVCSNRPYLFNTTVSNPGYGQMTFRWWYKKPSGAWTAFPSNIGTLTAAPLNVTNPTDPNAMWQGAYGQDLNLTNTDGLNGWQFRLQVIMPNCGDVSNEVTLTVRDKCLSGDCDLDNDGQINDVDLDDDNDQLADYWEAWMTTNNQIVSTTDFAGTGPWYYTVAGPVVVPPTIPASPYISYERCLVDTDNDGVYDNQEDPDGDNINNGEETDGDIIFDGNPLDPCSPVLGPTCIGINLAIRVGLQGAHIGVPNADTLMRATLRDYGPTHQQLIPTTEPYAAMTASFHHNGPDGGGTEEITTPSTTMAVTDKDAIVDWVFVELRSSTALDSVATTRAGLLQRDGDVVDMDGTSNLRFPFASANTYYVAVRHRNHLGVMTAEALDLSPALQEIDFMDPATLTNGTEAQVQLGSKMYMWCGDLNSDGRTIYQGPGNDILKLFTKVLFDANNTGSLANYISPGYATSDINLDGRSIYQGPANDRSMLLVNAILSHPANNTLISNFVILEMLP